MHSHRKTTNVQAAVTCALDACVVVVLVAGAVDEADAVAVAVVSVAVVSVASVAVVAGAVVAAGASA
jgi:hypothetical protein